MGKKPLLWLGILLWLGMQIGLFASPGWASPTSQGNNRLRMGQTTSGTLDDNRFRYLYVFNGQAEQVVSIAMTATEGDLDPLVLLMNIDNQILAVSDDDGAGFNAVISAFQLPTSGDYFIIATRFGHAHGTTTGDFRLTLDDIGTRGPQNTLTGQLIRLGQSVTGLLNNDTHQIIYRFEALRGQVVTIQLRRTSGNLDPLLDLFDGAGQPLRSTDDDPTAPDSLDARIENYLIPADGVYFIRATRYGRETGDSFGSYVLIVTEIPVEDLGTSGENARLLSYGDSINAEIDNERRLRYFQFAGSRGDVVSAFVSRLEGNLAPQLTLYDAEFRPLAASPDAPVVTSAQLTGVSLPADGLYYLVVSRYRGTEGTSIGRFNLQLTGRQGIGGVDYLEIVYGVELTGYIDAERVSEEYLFVGEAGDVITISMERVDGNLDTLLTLRDTTGKTLIFNDDIDENTQNSRIQRFTLPEDGVYIIEASRFERTLGRTSGTYQLALQKIR